MPDHKTMNVLEAKAVLSPEGFKAWKAEQTRILMAQSKAKRLAGTNVSLEESGFFDEPAETATHDEDGRPLILTESDLVRVITTGKL